MLSEHALGVGQRVGGEHEGAEHAASTGRLQDALRAFAEAELVWCGADPLATSGSSAAGSEPFDADADDDEDELWPAPDPSLAGESVVSVLGRWDYVVTDVDALLEHGRSTFLVHSPHAGGDEARRVLTVSDAVRETLQDPVLAALEEAPGLQLTTYVHQVLQHGGSPDEVFETDPFGLTRATGDLCSCGHERDPQDRHVRFSLPDALFAPLSEGREVPDLWMSHDDADSSLMVAAPGVGSFVRVLLTVALDDSSTVTYGTWLQVDHAELLRASEVWFAPQYEHLVLEGQLANDLPPGGVLGAHARAVVTDPDLLPRVQDSNDTVLARVLTEVWGADLHPDAQR